MGTGYQSPLSGAPRVRTPLRAGIVVLSLCCLAALSQGCDPLREGVMRATPGVPAPNGCVEGTAACIATGAGMVPAPCGDTHRMWPSLPRRADGTRRTCVAGCVVRDEPDARQAARCVGPDGGVR